MKPRLKKRDLLILVIALAVLVSTWLACNLIAPDYTVMALLILSSVVIIGITLESIRRIDEHTEDMINQFREQQRRDYQQIESMLSLFFTLKPALPLPSMRLWAASPDLLKLIAEVVLRTKPEFIVEASSGVSTLTIAYCLKHIGRGKVIALEHDAKFAAESQRHIDAHGLSSFAEVRHASLKNYDIRGQQFRWYDLDQLKESTKISLLVVDGPPGDVQSLARYPALPLLHQRLNQQVTVIADDTYRADEKEMVNRWMNEMTGFVLSQVDTEKGTSILTRSID